MERLKSLPLVARLACSFGAVLALLLLSTATGVLGLRSVHDEALHALNQDVRLAQAAADLHVLVLTARRYEKDAFINLDVRAKLDGYTAKWQDTRTGLERALQAMADMPLSDADRKAVQRAQAALPDYVRGFESTRKKMDAGLIGTAEDANREFEKYKDAVHDIETAVSEVTQRATQAAQGASVPLQAQYRHTLALQLGLAAASLLMGAAVCLIVARSISGQLGGEPAEVVASVQRVAQGDLATPVLADGAAAGSLIAAVAEMQRRLSALVSQIRGCADSIATGSNEIAAGNTDLSSRTEAQAASLQQTASSMEQLSGTLQSNSQTTRDATALAEAATAAATAGGEAISRVMSTMEGISSASRRIGDIIGVIDGIAFQTNILALNAAVEAARAGEQGRGFAVVAAEVRNLAQRSAQAAREIKSLIADSMEKVEAGSRLVTDAGGTVSSIVERVHEVGTLIARISQATQEQAGGIVQVGEVIHNLDTSTQQNAALVEQSAAAAVSLKQQSQRLVAAVSTFQLKS
jgi:methyl-accepting chemotaxis protein